uniref:CA-responsive protein n=1 Tax=Nelumbo nucifera TaxID=4432 RepID=A0A822ZVR8_NELNU|nr:TPA_asm: hypothetical protein HUJ06_018924 [Nelumbo nucifera]
MAIATSTLSSIFFSSSSLVEYRQQLHQPMFYIQFFVLCFLSLCFLFIVMHKRLKRTENKDGKSSPNSLSIYRCPLSNDINKAQQQSETHQNHPLIVEILTSSPSKWASLVSSVPSHLTVGNGGKAPERLLSDGSELGKEGGDPIDKDCGKSGDQSDKKKKKKRAKKKQQQNFRAEDSGEDECLESQVPLMQDKHGFDCLYPFTSSSSVTQRKIKQQYDQLVKSNDSKALTLAQVCQFANCLIEARNELKHKSEIIQRKFTITKALLFKADRSSFDRLCQQMYKLEAEQKRLEEDALVYNRLQQQLKLSPAYKKVLLLLSLCFFGDPSMSC